MSKFLFSLSLIIIIIGISMRLLYAKPPVVAPPAMTPEQKVAEARKKDSLEYQNLVNNSNIHTFKETENEILFANGMKIKFIKMSRFPIPRGVGVIIPDPISQWYNYQLAELEIQATNTTTHDIKIDPSEAVFVSLKLYGPDNNWKSYSSQFELSMGSIYLKTEPAQPEKSKAVYNEAFQFFNQSYKPGQTKTCKAIIVAIAKSAQHIDRIVVTTKEFGQNISYACPAKL